MPAPIVLANLEPATKMGNESPKIATRFDLRDGSRGDSGGDTGNIAGLTVTALDGSIAHGNRIRIEADASYAIGPKDQAAPKWWQMGQDVRIGGTPQTPEAIGQSITGTYLGGVQGYVEASSGQLRHDKVDRAFLSLGRGNLVNPTAYWPETSAAAGRRYYQSMWVWCGQNYSGAMMMKISNLSGAFQLNADRTPAEDVELLSGDGLRTLTGKATHYYGPTRELTVEASSWGSTSDFFNGTVTGLTSGATATIDADPYGFGRFISSSSTKFSRPRTIGIQPGVYYTFSSARQFYNVAKDASGASLNTANQGMAYVSKAPQQTPREWVQIEWVIDLSSDNDLGGKAYFYQNGELLYQNEVSDTTAIRANGTFVQIDNIGMESSVGGADNYGTSQYWGEVYADNDSRRLYLCDAPTVAASTTRELLRPEAWTQNPDGSVVIDAVIYQGALASLTGKYLALVDGNTPIFEGVTL